MIAFASCVAWGLGGGILNFSYLNAANANFLRICCDNGTGFELLLVVNNDVVDSGSQLPGSEAREANDSLVRHTF